MGNQLALARQRPPRRQIVCLHPMPPRHLVHRNTRDQRLGYHPTLSLIRPSPLWCRSCQPLHKPNGLHTALPMDSH